LTGKKRAKITGITVLVTRVIAKNKIFYVGFEVLTMVVMESSIFWD
jgi:hypothetical protein